MTIEQGDAAPELRRRWFLEFQHWYNVEFRDSFTISPYADWTPGVSEGEWRVFARGPDGDEAAASLPVNFAWFRPQSVARSIVARLLDDVVQGVARAHTTGRLNSSRDRPRRERSEQAADPEGQ